MRALLVRLDGTTEEVDLPDDGQLKAMAEALKCDEVGEIPLIRTAPGRPSLSMWMDRDGLFTKGPNVVGSDLVAHMTGLPIGYCMGDVLLTGGADSEGDPLPLTRVQSAVLEEMAFEAKQRFELVISQVLAAHPE